MKRQTVLKFVYSFFGLYDQNLVKKLLNAPLIGLKKVAAILKNNACKCNTKLRSNFVIKIKKSILLLI